MKAQQQNVSGVQPLFDCAQLKPADAKYVREREDEIRSLGRQTAASIVKIGRDLTEVKERIGHGKFLAWIKAAFAWKEQTARNFMNVAKQFKSTTVGDLQIDLKALYLLAAPKTPEAVREDVVKRATTGKKRITHEEVKALRAHFNETGELPKDLGKLVALASETKKEMDALPPLPSAAEARRIAIATGLHTMDKTGAYQPPVTVAEQEGVAER